MKNQTIKILIFVVVLCFVSIMISNLSFFKINVGNEKWQWIREKIFLKKDPIEIAIIGSSYSWCAIRPTLISQAFAGKRVYNFGRNWHGRDADYFIIKNLAQNHNIKRILLEFRDIENQKPHQYIPYIIEPRETLDEFFFNFKLLNYADVITYSKKLKETVYHVIKCIGDLSVRPFVKVIQFGIKNIILQENNIREKKRKQFEKGHGYYLHGDSRPQEESFLKRYGNTKILKVHKIKSNYPNNYLTGTRADFYLKKIKKVAEDKNIKLSFVYVPTFRKHFLPSQETFNYYSELGDVLLPNIEGIFRLDYWRDKNHLFKEGSSKFTEELIFLLKKGGKASPHYYLYESID